MARTKTAQEQIANTQDKIASVQEQIKQMENRIKQLTAQKSEQERKARTHRICKRGGIVEKLLPDLAAFTDEQFQVFLNKVILTEHTKRIIANITAEKKEEPATPNITAFTRQNSETTPANTTYTEQGAD